MAQGRGNSTSSAHSVSVKRRLFGPDRVGGPVGLICWGLGSVSGALWFRVRRNDPFILGPVGLGWQRCRGLATAQHTIAELALFLLPLSDRKKMKEESTKYQPVMFDMDPFGDKKVFRTRYHSLMS